MNNFELSLFYLRDKFRRFQNILDINEQRRLELVSVFYITIFMVISALTFFLSTDSVVLKQFSQEIGISITNRHYAILSLIGTGISIVPLLPLKIGRVWKQQIYLAASYPLIAYTIPMGWYAWTTGSSGIGIMIYLLFEFSFFIISRAVWRREKPIVIPPTDPTHTS
jgi:hypothetical protein